MSVQELCIMEFKEQFGFAYGYVVILYTSDF